MKILLELIREIPFAIISLLLLIELLELLDEILADISILLLDGTGNLHSIFAWDFLFSIN